MELTLPETTDRAFSYISCIRMNGRPILPPLMTASKRQEMAEYRRQATIAETRIIRRKIERAHKLWEKGNEKLTLTDASLGTKNSKKDGIEENNTRTMYPQHCKNKAEFDDALKNQTPCHNNFFPNNSGNMWYETEHSNVCCDSNRQAFINAEDFNYCDSKDCHTYIKEMSFPLGHNTKNNSSKLSSTYIISDKKRDNGTSLQSFGCDNGLAITEGTNDGIVDEIQECNFETDTDSTLLSTEQSTDLEKYLDMSVGTSTTNSILETPSLCQCNEKKANNGSVLNCSSSSINTTLCPSLEGSSETLVPLISQKSDTEEKECETPVNCCDANCDFNLASDEFTSVSEDNTANTMRCHVRRSSYTLDEPSPALMLAMEDSHQSPVDLPDNFICNPLNNEEFTRNDSSINAIENQENHFVNSISSKNSQVMQDTLDAEISTINNAISSCNVCDNQNNDISEILKCNSNNDANQIKLVCLDKKTTEHEKNCDVERNRIMLTMKDTMEKLFQEPEKNFESYRERLSELHQQQMMRLLARQNEQWQRLLEEEANEECEEVLLQNPVYETLVPRIVDNSKVMHNKNQSIENDVNDDMNKHADIPEIRIENLSEDCCERKKAKLAHPFSPDLQLKFNKVSAAAKGYLTRRLMKSERVQRIIQTIKDTLLCAMRFHQESPIKQGRVTEKDAQLHKGLITQLTAACYELHDVFFKLTIKEKMEIIRQTREKKKKNSTDLSDTMNNRKCLSNATLKVLERKKSNKSSIVADTIEGKKMQAKYCFKTLRSSENAPSLLKLPSRRGNAPPVRSSHSPPVRKYARQASPKHDFQKAARKSAPVRKRLLDNNTQKR